MATNLALDDKLIEEVQKLGNFPTKKAAVTAALKEFIRLQQARKLTDLFGTIEFREDWNYKAARRKRDQKVKNWQSED